jgi:hypothetical protein
MRVPNAVHEQRSWVMGRIAPDFRLMDVWELPVEGGREQFAEFLETMASFDVTHEGSSASRFLFWVRLRLGQLLGWDDGVARPIPGCTETSLADRLPAELRGTAQAPVINPVMQEAAGGFQPLFRTDDEWAAEISNATVHGVMQVTWVPVGERFRAHMAVYVKPRGLMGQAYLRLIDPFRHVIVYPSLLKQVGRRWAGAAP